ncbi:hypothetical protein L2E82_19785 [Cichorium intybus]|uniref:Uncharacterized protein n=1 Tax=Cichorium intybus TaxID=13427 RepID=A0ACB9DS83_CICIN|nr:hypothetical protein L2E82_19785 [Cichorium intybus]
MKLKKMMTSNPISFFILLALIGLLIPTLLIPFWVLKIKTVEKEVDLITKKSHQEKWSVIQHATTTLLPLNSSATNLAKVANMFLGNTDPTFSDIESKVSPLLFQALLTIPRLSQISYIRKDGLFFALYFKNHQEIFAIYSNTSFSTATKYSCYTQPVDSNLNSGKLYGDAVVFPPRILVNETWLQQALNTTNGCTSLGKSLNNSDNLLVLNTAPVDQNGVISLGFDLKSLMDVFSDIKTSGGGLYLATKDGQMILDGNKTIFSQLFSRYHGNFTSESQILEISGRKYIAYSSSVDIIGMESVCVLALPYDGVQTTMHKNVVFVVLLILVIYVTVAISIFNSVVSMMRAARKEMCLRAALIKQKEATQQAERKGKNQSLAFVTASHDIRASLAGIAGLLEMSINEVDGGSELEKNLRLVQTCSEDLYGILNAVLDTSKIEAGKLELEEKRFDLIKAVEEVVELFYPVALKKGVDVILDLQVGPLTKFSQVKGDERRLKQILSNLLSNAIKFTSEGNVSVRAWTRKPRFQNPRFDSRPTGCLSFKRGDLEAMDEIRHDPNCMEFVFEVDDTGKGIPKEKQASVFENYVQVKETAPELEGTGLGLGIVQSLVRLMGGEISIVDKDVGERGTCFKFNVLFHVCGSDLSIISEDDKSVKSTPGDLSSGPNTPFCSPKRPGNNSSIVVLFISSDERRKMTQKFLAAQGIRVLAVKNMGQLSETLRELRQEQENVCSSRSDLSLSFGYLTWPSPKGVPLSALDGTDVTPTRRNNQGNVSNFILLVIDTTRVDFLQLCKPVAEFRKHSKNACSRIVWLGSRCIQLHGLDEKKLPPSDIIIPMPLHGSRLHSLLGLLPEFGGKFPDTPPHANQRQLQIRNQNRQEEIQEIVRVSTSSSSPLRGKKVLVAEDDSLQQIIAKKILLKLGVTFEMCRNGKEALAMVSKGLNDQRNLGASHILPFEYIFMDCQMPEMDGCEATRLIRLEEKDYGVHIPIIGLTAHAEGEELNNFFVAGIDIHISKPLNEQKIMKVIEDLHRRR